MQRQSTNPFISPQPARDLHPITKEQQKTFQHMTYFQSTQFVCPPGQFQPPQPHQIPVISLLHVFLCVSKMTTFIFQYLQQMSMVNAPVSPIEMMSSKPKAQSSDSLAMRPSQTPTHTAFMVPSFPTSSEHGVYVSHIEDGPELFHVQFKDRQEDLLNLMDQLKTVKLEMLDRRAQPCQPVIARYSLDKQLYRALIMSVKTHACEVLYVDYGNTEILRYENIFKMPDVFLGPPVFAISFALANHRSLGSVISNDLKIRFDHLVRTCSLRLKVAPWQGPPLVQWCELFDNEKSILESLLQFQNMKNCHFMPPICLNVGDQERAFVCYIHSPKQFYVQLKKFDSTFESMIDEMERELSKLTNNTPSEDTLKPGLAVAAMYEDNSWYRGQIHQILKDKVIVQFIDFGNYEKIAFQNLRFIPGQKYIDVAPQAVECCLKSFEYEDKDSDATRTQFELMVQNSDNQRKMMKLHVMGKIRDSILLVELFDESLSPPLNVNKVSRILYSISIV
jgi:Tudor domain